METDETIIRKNGETVAKWIPFEKASLENDELKKRLLIRGDKELLVRIGAEDVENGIDSVHQSVGARGQDVVRITFTESASNMLRTFSDQHRDKLVAIIVDHKVRHIERLRSQLSGNILLDVEKWPVSTGKGGEAPLTETRMFYWHPLFIPFVVLSLIFIAFVVLAIIPVRIEENRNVPLTLRIIIAVLTLLVGTVSTGVEQTTGLADGAVQYETSISLLHASAGGILGLVIGWYGAVAFWKMWLRAYANSCRLLKWVLPS